MPVTSFTSGDPAAAGARIFPGDVLPDGTVGAAYSVEESTAATGTATPVTYSILSGSLPPGLSLSAVEKNWKICGTPTRAGKYSFTLRCTNSVGNTNVNLSIGIRD